MALLQAQRQSWGRYQKSPDKPRPKEEQALFSLWLLESHSSILPMNACESLESLDSSKQGCSEETEDKVYSLLRILPRPARHSGRLRQHDHKFKTSLDTLVRLCPLENKACVLGAGG